MAHFCPRLVLAALRGGSGKTTITLGLLASWRQRGRKITPFKKGPDYIDPAWHSLAAGNPCYNLDTFLMEPPAVLDTVIRHTSAADGALIEGNRGLYDGVDVWGTYSTAELAKQLQAPVVLVVDCTMTTRTVAALVLGCRQFDPAVNLAGVILNQIARPRHEALLRTAIEYYCQLPVLGALPRLKCSIFPERHMGLIPPTEHRAATQAVATAQALAEKYLEVERLWQLACQAPPLPESSATLAPPSISCQEPPVIGYLRDAAFHFYYPENLEALQAAGARLVEVNALSESRLPELDALYIGGGFPETNAAALADNKLFRQALRQAIDQGLPVYAECGGLMFLGQELIVGERSFPMVGALPFAVVLETKPQGHGYTILEVIHPNPYFPVGTKLRGHEFHYSRLVEPHDPGLQFVFRMERGQGITGQLDGLCHRKVLATYTHLHALATPEWAPALVRQAWEFRQARQALAASAPEIYFPRLKQSS